jgi:hypothetical protein
VDSGTTQALGYWDSARQGLKDRRERLVLSNRLECRISNTDFRTLDRALACGLWKTFPDYELNDRR